jgi:hypothetical protein
LSLEKENVIIMLLWEGLVMLQLRIEIGAELTILIIRFGRTMSSFVQNFLAKLVTGKKTSTSFKNVHLNNYAKAVNDHFKINMTGDQIFNHLKTLKKSTLELTT